METRFNIFRIGRLSGEDVSVAFPVSVVEGKNLPPNEWTRGDMGNAPKVVDTRLSTITSSENQHSLEDAVMTGEVEDYPEGIGKGMSGKAMSDIPPSEDNISSKYISKADSRKNCEQAHKVLKSHIISISALKNIIQPILTKEMDYKVPLMVMSLMNFWSSEDLEAYENDKISVVRSNRTNPTKNRITGRLNVGSPNDGSPDRGNSPGSGDAKMDSSPISNASSKPPAKRRNIEVPESNGQVVVMDVDKTTSESSANKTTSSTNKATIDNSKAFYTEEDELLTHPLKETPGFPDDMHIDDIDVESIFDHYMNVEEPLYPASRNQYSNGNTSGQRQIRIPDPTDRHILWKKCQVALDDNIKLDLNRKVIYLEAGDNVMMLLEGENLILAESFDEIAPWSSQSGLVPQSMIQSGALQGSLGPSMIQSGIEGALSPRDGGNTVVKRRVEIPFSDLNLMIRVVPGLHARSMTEELRDIVETGGRMQLLRRIPYSIEQWSTAVFQSNVEDLNSFRYLVDNGYFDLIKMNEEEKITAKRAAGGAEKRVEAGNPDTQMMEPVVAISAGSVTTGSTAPISGSRAALARTGSGAMGRTSSGSNSGKIGGTTIKSCDLPGVLTMFKDPNRRRNVVRILFSLISTLHSKYANEPSTDEWHECIDRHIVECQCAILLILKSPNYHDWDDRHHVESFFEQKGTSIANSYTQQAGTQTYQTHATSAKRISVLLSVDIDAGSTALHEILQCYSLFCGIAGAGYTNTKQYKFPASRKFQRLQYFEDPEVPRPIRRDGNRTSDQRRAMELGEAWAGGFRDRAMDGRERRGHHDNARDGLFDNSEREERLNWAQIPGDGGSRTDINPWEDDREYHSGRHTLREEAVREVANPANEMYFFHYRVPSRHWVYDVLDLILKKTDANVKNRFHQSPLYMALDFYWKQERRPDVGLPEASLSPGGSAVASYGTAATNHGRLESQKVDSKLAFWYSEFWLEHVRKLESNSRSNKKSPHCAQNAEQYVDWIGDLWRNGGFQVIPDRKASTTRPKDASSCSMTADSINAAASAGLADDPLITSREDIKRGEDSASSIDDGFGEWHKKVDLVSPKSKKYERNNTRSPNQEHASTSRPRSTTRSGSILAVQQECQQQGADNIIYANIVSGQDIFRALVVHHAKAKLKYVVDRDVMSRNFIKTMDSNVGTYDGILGSFLGSKKDSAADGVLGSILGSSVPALSSSVMQPTSSLSGRGGSRSVQKESVVADNRVSQKPPCWNLHSRKSHIKNSEFKDFKKFIRRIIASLHDSRVYRKGVKEAVDYENAVSNPVESCKENRLGGQMQITFETSPVGVSYSEAELSSPCSGLRSTVSPGATALDAMTSPDSDPPEPKLTTALSTCSTMNAKTMSITSNVGALAMPSLYAMQDPFYAYSQEYSTLRYWCLTRGPEKYKETNATISWGQHLEASVCYKRMVTMTQMRDALYRQLDTKTGSRDWSVLFRDLETLRIDSYAEIDFGGLMNNMTEKSQIESENQGVSLTANSGANSTRASQNPVSSTSVDSPRGTYALKDPLALSIGEIFLVPDDNRARNQLLQLVFLTMNSGNASTGRGWESTTLAVDYKKDTTTSKASAGKDVDMRDFQERPGTSSCDAFQELHLLVGNTDDEMYILQIVTGFISNLLQEFSEIGLCHLTLRKAQRFLKKSRREFITSIVSMSLADGKSRPDRNSTSLPSEKKRTIESELTEFVFERLVMGKDSKSILGSPVGSPNQMMPPKKKFISKDLGDLIGRVLDEIWVDFPTKFLDARVDVFLAMYQGALDSSPKALDCGASPTDRKEFKDYSAPKKLSSAGISPKKLSSGSPSPTNKASPGKVSGPSGKPPVHLSVRHIELLQNRLLPVVYFHLKAVAEVEEYQAWLQQQPENYFTPEFFVKHKNSKGDNVLHCLFISKNLEFLKNVLKDSLELGDILDAGGRGKSKKAQTGSELFQISTPHRIADTFLRLIVTNFRSCLDVENADGITPKQLLREMLSSDI